MSYRDDTQAMRERLLALEHRAGEADRLAERLRQLERENLELQKEVDRLRPRPVEPPDAPTGEAPPELPALSVPVAAAQELRRLRTEGRWDAVAALLEAQSAKVPAPSRIALLLHLAATYDEKLGDRERAMATCQRVLELDPGDRHALLHLQRLYTDSERWMDLCTVLERRIGLSQDDRSTAFLYLHLARITDEVLGDRERAIQHCRRSIETWPSAEAHGLLEKLSG